MLKNIKLLREESGISQQKLAEIIDMSQQSVNAYENNDVQPDLATLITIADYFETSVDYVIGHTEIRRKMEPVEQYDLNQQESRHMDTYRKLRAVSRRNIDALISDLLDK